MIITEASFPTPHLIKQTNNPALWDQHGRFASHQAAASNELLNRLNFDLNRVAGQEKAYATLVGDPPDAMKRSTRTQRSGFFAELYKDLAKWRSELARQSEGRAESSSDAPYSVPIGAHFPITDIFGPGIRSDGSSFDLVDYTFTAGDETPASRLSARIGKIIQDRFEAEAPDAEVLQNRVTLPNGEVVNGNQLLRGLAASTARWRSTEKAMPDLYVTSTGKQEDRRRLQQEAFELLADLEERRAAGLAPDADARRKFTEAAYFLYQGPEYQRGGDAMIRVLLVTAHARVFDEAVRLPQDIDVMAYAADQQAFCEYFGRTQSIISGEAPTASAALQTAAARPQERRQGLERG